MPEYIMEYDLDDTGKLINARRMEEVVRCKECKHWREGTVYFYCDKLYRMGVLETFDYMTDEDDYCSMAERKTNG